MYKIKYMESGDTKIIYLDGGKKGGGDSKDESKDVAAAVVATLDNEDSQQESSDGDEQNEDDSSSIDTESLLNLHPFSAILENNLKKFFEHEGKTSAQLLHELNAKVDALAEKLEAMKKTDGVDEGAGAGSDVDSDA